MSEMSGGSDPAQAHLLAELDWLDAVLDQEVARWRSRMAKDQVPQLKGVVISEGEVDQLLRATHDTSEDRDGTSEVADLAMTARMLRSAALAGRRFALPHLTATFRLTELEEKITLICLAPEIDSRYERLYGYLQDDVTRKRPSPDLIARLLHLNKAERLSFLHLWDRSSPLFYYGLIEMGSDTSRPLLTRDISLNPVAAGALLQMDMPDIELAQEVVEVTPLPLERLRWPASLTDPLVQLVCRAGQDDTTPRQGPVAIHLCGPEGTGKKTLAAAVCRKAGLALVAANARAVCTHPRGIGPALKDCFLFARVRRAGLLLEHSDLLEPGEQIAFEEHWLQCAKSFGLPLFIGAVHRWQPSRTQVASRVWPVELPAPDAGARAELWPQLASGIGFEVGPDLDWDTVSGVFRLTPGQMLTALKIADSRLQLYGGPDTLLSADVLHISCADASAQALGDLATKLDPSHTWDDLVLPPDTLAQLREICGHLQHRRLVYGTWGFGARRMTGNGLCVLFHGGSGTGKTLAVEVIARELQMRAFRIDLSTVVSKYIGDTEKNLRRIFEEAESSNALLFFDEADALFGKRSEVKDAHDRFANIEINYLLQRVESYQGPVFLATNVRNHIDDAFFRRMNFAVEFPLPNEALRYRLWRCHLPLETPLGSDVDLDFLARRFALAGGNIRNVAVNAAFLGASESRKLHMRHFIVALQREYEKLGMRLTDHEIRPYSLTSERVVGPHNRRDQMSTLEPQ